jgi:hypothetical protein
MTNLFIPTTAVESNPTKGSDPVGLLIYIILGILIAFGLIWTGITLYQVWKEKREAAREEAREEELWK